MKKLKFNPLPYILFFIIFILSIITFKDKIQNYASNDSNNMESDNIFIDNEYKIDGFTKATVKRVVDGDTIIVIIDNTEYKVRLIGVNSPEYTTKIEEYGKEATNYTTKMLTGKTVYLEKDVSETDKYDRLLRYVWLQLPNSFTETEIKGKMFNSILVLNGYAEAATYPPDVKYANFFKEFAKIARDKNVGLWQYN